VGGERLIFRQAETMKQKDEERVHITVTEEEGKNKGPRKTKN
jgi:hypothetical protein